MRSPIAPPPLPTPPLAPSPSSLLSCSRTRTRLRSRWANGKGHNTSASALIPIHYHHLQVDTVLESSSVGRHALQIAQVRASQASEHPTQHHNNAPAARIGGGCIRAPAPAAAGQGGRCPKPTYVDVSREPRRRNPCLSPADRRPLPARARGQPTGLQAHLAGALFPGMKATQGVFTPTMGTQSCNLLTPVLFIIHTYIYIRTINRYTPVGTARAPPPSTSPTGPSPRPSSCPLAPRAPSRASPPSSWCVCVSVSGTRHLYTVAVCERPLSGSTDRLTSSTKQ